MLSYFPATSYLLNPLLRYTCASPSPPATTSASVSGNFSTNSIPFSAPITEIAVAKRPYVAIIATGDEVVHPSLEPEPGQIRDISSYTVAAQTSRAGGIPVIADIVPDDFEALKGVAEAALETYDMLVMSALILKSSPI